jgi:hypothetical protein
MGRQAKWAKAQNAGGQQCDLRMECRVPTRITDQALARREEGEFHFARYHRRQPPGADIASNTLHIFLASRFRTGKVADCFESVIHVSCRKKLSGLAVHVSIT